MSERQAAKHYAQGDASNLRKLVRGSPWFERFHVLGKHWELTEPIAVWKPGDPEWDHEAISYEAITRWNRTETLPLSTYRSTRRALGLFGGHVHKLGTSSAHHLGVAAIYLALLESTPQSLAQWQIENSRFLARGTKRPDAYLGPTMLDFLGHYQPRRLREIWRMGYESEPQREVQVW